MSEQYPSQPPKQDDFQKGFKMMLGGCAALVVVGAIVVGGLFMLGALPLAFFGSKTTNQNIAQVIPPKNEVPKDEAERVAWLQALPKEEKLKRRQAIVEAGNKNWEASASKSGILAVGTLTGSNQEAITIKVSSPYSSKTGAIRAFAMSFFESFPGDDQTRKDLITLELESVVVTDGKRTWTKILKTGELIEKLQ